MISRPQSFRMSRGGLAPAGRVHGRAHACGRRRAAGRFWDRLRYRDSSSRRGIEVGEIAQATVEKRNDMSLRQPKTGLSV